jgi:hypothetical protein
VKRILRSVLFTVAVVSPASVSRATLLPLAPAEFRSGTVTVHPPMKIDVSVPLVTIADSGAPTESPDCEADSCGTSPEDPAQPQKNSASAPAPVLPPAAIEVEQRSQGNRPPLPLLESFDGLGVGFAKPSGETVLSNPSDNSLAVGPNHIVQIVNSRLAIYTKKSPRYPKSGELLYGAVATNTLFVGFGGVCEARNNGDAVVRYDQLAKRWLFVMPIFRPISPQEFSGRDELRQPGQPVAAGPAVALPPDPPTIQTGGGERHRLISPEPKGTFAMCYAVSTTEDPLGPYYRYAFSRALFPDYPRPSIWPDGYYVPTSTGDTVIQKHICIADRLKMLMGKPATEQCIVIDGVNFLNTSDVDGQSLPPAGAPNITMAAGGTQLKNIFDDDGMYYWKVHVDWNNPANTKAMGPKKITVAPYHYLCNGQLTNCVPQPGTDQRLDVQGDKIMQRLVYRRVGRHEFIVAAHSVSTRAGAGGVRWYEFRLDKNRNPQLYQQGTYAPDQFYRWMPSIAMDRKGDIGVGYSFGGTPNFAGQRFAARLVKDPKGQLTFHETRLADGEAAQTSTLRWEDYTTTAIDPSDDCTFWYVGDYFKAGDAGYRTRIGSFTPSTCLRSRQ